MTVVGDHQEELIEVMSEIGEKMTDLSPCFVIHPRGRFVENNKASRAHQCPRDQHPLTLPSREFIEGMLRLIGQTDPLEGRFKAIVTLLAREHFCLMCAPPQAHLDHVASAQRRTFEGEHLLRNPSPGSGRSELE